MNCQRPLISYSAVVFTGDWTDAAGPFADFERLETNAAALQVAKEFAQERINLGLIDGVAGWGKTHLLRSAAAAFQSRAGVKAAIMSALEFADSRAPCFPEVLILDDLHLVERRPRAKQRLSFELERRGRLGRPTLCAASSPSAFDHRGLRRNWKTGTLKEPTEEERRRVLKRLCERESVELSLEQAAAIVRLVKGDGATYRGIARRLRQSEQPISQCHVLKLAGMLEQYVSANGWDLRDLILDAAALSTKSESRTQLAVYLMRKEAGLPEPKVAAYFELSPGEIYSIQKRADVQNRELDAKFRGSLTRALDLIRARICPEL